jgi:hypothetical protein
MEDMALKRRCLALPAARHLRMISDPSCSSRSRNNRSHRNDDDDGDDDNGSRHHNHQWRFPVPARSIRCFQADPARLRCCHGQS